MFRNIFFFKSKRDNRLYIFRDNQTSLAKTEEIIRRIKYFESSSDLVFLESIPPIKWIDFSRIILLAHNKHILKRIKLKRNEVFNLDFDNNYSDAWEYHRLLSGIRNNDIFKEISLGKMRLKTLRDKLTKDYSKAYIFGTGPSLEKAISENFKDGIRIVCNTIVKDEEIWLHIDPHLIVAADAIYHFGMGQFARSFRSDLNKRLSSTKTYFVYPAIFHSFCKIAFSKYEERLIPIPNGSISTIHHDLTEKYGLSSHGNVLVSMLLPLACTFSRHIFLWGFDGRAPGDKLFWKNSSRHFYEEQVHELINLHPAFYKTLVPEEAPELYVKKFHGTVLDRAMAKAESEGFHFTMMHETHTETLQKRYAKHLKIKL